MSSKKSKFPIIDVNICVACGVCAKVCPKKAITIYRGRYACVDNNLCVGCGKCAKKCPASVISMKKQENNKDE